MAWVERLTNGAMGERVGWNGWVKGLGGMDG